MNEGKTGGDEPYINEELPMLKVHSTDTSPWQYIAFIYKSVNYF